MSPEITLRKIAPTTRDLADLREAAGQNADAGSHCIAITLRAYQLKVEEMVAVASTVVQQQGRVPIVAHNHIRESIIVEVLLEIRDEEIEPAVIVVVAQGNAHSSHHASTSGQTHPGDRSNLIELAVALIVVKKRVESIVGHEQIGPAVVVVVSRPHGEILALRIVDSRGLRYVCESAVAVVVVENVGSTFVSGRGAARARAADDAVPRTIRPYVD